MYGSKGLCHGPQSSIHTTLRSEVVQISRQIQGCKLEVGPLLLKDKRKSTYVPLIGYILPTCRVEELNFAHCYFRIIIFLLLHLKKIIIKIHNEFL